MCGFPPTLHIVQKLSYVIYTIICKLIGLVGFFVCLFLFFGTGFLCRAQAVLELTVDQAGLVLRNLPASAL